MYKVGLKNRMKMSLFAWKFDNWVYKHESDEGYSEFIDNWDEFWDKYTDVVVEICTVIKPKTIDEAFNLFCNIDIVKTYYLWLKESRWTEADLKADILYLTWMSPLRES